MMLRVKLPYVLLVSGATLFTNPAQGEYARHFINLYPFQLQTKVIQSSIHLAVDGMYLGRPEELQNKY